MSGNMGCWFRDQSNLYQNKDRMQLSGITVTGLYDVT